MAKKAKVRVKGVVLLEAFLALLLMAIASYGMAVGNSVQFSQMAAGRESDSAKNYAELEAEYLKSLGFDAVVTNNKDDDDPSRTPRYPDGEQSSVDKASNARDMTKFLGDTLGSEWRSTATLGKTINNINGDSDNKIQNIVVSVYKKSDGDNASPRATVTLPLSSQGNGDSHYVVESFYGTDNWYRKYNDGWIEQGGLVKYGQKRGQSAYFLKPFSKCITSFQFSTNAQWPDGRVYRAYSTSLTGFVMGADGFDSHYTNELYFNYYACGF